MVSSDKVVRPQSGEWSCGLCGRAEGTLHIITQEISLIHDHPVLFHESPVLFGKGSDAMVLFLPHDIVNDVISLLAAIAEACIFSPPTAECREMRIDFQPFAAISFHPLYE